MRREDLNSKRVKIMGSKYLGFMVLITHHITVDGEIEEEYNYLH